MAFENIQIEYGNFTIDRSGSVFYTIDHDTNSLISKNSSGTVIFSYFLAEDVQEVQSLQFDGVHYWTLERQGTSGFRVRKWEIGTDNLVRVVDVFSFISDAIVQYDTHAFAVEHYSDSLDNSVLTGATSFDLNDAGTITIGDRITIGPSTAVGFEGDFSETVVTNKAGSTVTVSPAVSSDFSPNDEVYFTRNLFVFSDLGLPGTAGALYKFDAFSGTLKTLTTSGLYNLVRGATFFKDYVMFVRGGEVVWLDPDSQGIFKSQAIDNLNVDRTEHLIAHDLAGFGDLIYRLETEHVFLSGGTYQTEQWTDEFNYNTSTTVPEVYFVAVKAEPTILHKSVVGLTPESEITIQVLDQFRTPVFNRPVSLTSDGGAVSPSSGNTDAEGVFESTYTANTDVGEITIEATVT